MTTGKKRGRTPITGRYATRRELCDAIWRQYLNSPAKPSQIARIERVSEGTVHKILNTKEGYPHPQEGVQA